jgi:DNA-binding CsgD family transcriptional regulator
MSARAAQIEFLQTALQRGDAAAAASAAWLMISDGTSLLELYDDVVMPFFVHLERHDREGDLGMADEHVASRAVEELVVLLSSRQLPWAGLSQVSANRGTLVLGAVPGEQHVLGVRMMAHALQARGWSVQVLDALPYSALARYCAALPQPPAAIGLTMHLAPPVGVLRSGITVLRDALPETPVVLGGSAVARNPGLALKVGAAGGAVSIGAGVGVLEEVTNPLTRRERQILELVAGGASNAQIASTLSVHSSTVKTHLEHVAGKLGTSDRTAAAVQGLRRGWIT